MEMMIRIENLTRRFGKVRALRGLSLNVKRGAVYGFLGPNGAGKTTTLRILAGLLRADQGQVWINGQAIPLQALGHRPVMGVMPEEPAFYPWMTPREYLRDFLAPFYTMNKVQATQRAKELLSLVGLSEAADRRIGGFSRGMRQRLGMAQALINQPELLLLDEPVSALDPAGRREVLNLIESLKGQATIILSTHILADVDRVCDSIGIIERGKMLIEAERQELLERYALPIFEVEVENGFGQWPEVIKDAPAIEQIQIMNRIARISVQDVELARRALLSSFVDNGLQIRRFEISTPSLEDVFLKITHQEPRRVEGAESSRS